MSISMFYLFFSRYLQDRQTDLYQIFQEEDGKWDPIEKL